MNLKKNSAAYSNIMFNTHIAEDLQFFLVQFLNICPAEYNIFLILYPQIPPSPRAEPQPTYEPLTSPALPTTALLMASCFPALSSSC